MAEATGSASSHWDNLKVGAGRAGDGRQRNAAVKGCKPPTFPLSQPQQVNVGHLPVRRGCGALEEAGVTQGHLVCPENVTAARAECFEPPEDSGWHIGRC